LEKGTKEPCCSHQKLAVEAAVAWLAKAKVPLAFDTRGRPKESQRHHKEVQGTRQTPKNPGQKRKTMSWWQKQS
jgi:hypothetical protein